METTAEFGTVTYINNNTSPITVLQVLLQTVDCKYTYYIGLRLCFANDCMTSFLYVYISHMLRYSLLYCSTSLPVSNLPCPISFWLPWKVSVCKTWWWVCLSVWPAMATKLLCLLFLRHFHSKIFQSLLDDNTHWAFHFRTGFDDIDVMSQSQGCQKTNTKGCIFLLKLN